MGLVDELAFRGLVHQVTDEALFGRLAQGPLTLYAGFDPTAPSLHVGNLLQLCTLRRFQLAGHRTIALAGGGTAAVGDPGGKSEERPLLSDEELAAHLEGLRSQLARFVDLEAGVVVDNRRWWSSMNVLSFLRDIGKHFTVNQMMAKESVRARLERPEQGISYSEFSYMLLQAYDFLRLFDDQGCVLQIGGSDQWGNITMGVDLVRRVRGEQVFGLTTPLVTKADGTKFGKTEEGAIWLDAALTSPYRLYQFFVQVGDAEVGRYLRYFTFLGEEDIAALDASTAEHPERRSAQRALAKEVCRLVHGEAQAKAAEAASQALFAGTLATLDEATMVQVVDETPSSEVPASALQGRDGDALTVTDALVAAGVARSRADARRAVAQGGIYVNDRREEEADRPLGPADLLHGRFVVLRRGRRHYHVLRAR